MKLARLLESRPPTTGWLLDPELAAVVRRDGKGTFHCAHAVLPEGLFEIGPIGLQNFDRKRLLELLRPLQQRLAGARRVAIVIPTGWTRSHLLEFDHMPRGSSELHEVVRWRLKKLLPVLPSELRLTVIPYQSGGRRQVLCTSGLDRVLTELEATFADLGVEPGLIAPRLFALAHGVRHHRGLVLTVQYEAGLLALLLLSEGRPSLLRTKLLPPGGEAWSLVTGELHVALTYLRETFAVPEPLPVVASAASTEMEQALSEWWAAQEGVVVESLPVPPCSELGTALDSARLRPVQLVLEQEGLR
jgi:hypothetical protein